MKWIAVTIRNGVSNCNFTNDSSTAVTDENGELVTNFLPRSLAEEKLIQK